MAQGPALPVSRPTYRRARNWALLLVVLGAMPAAAQNPFETLFGDEPRLQPAPAAKATPKRAPEKPPAKKRIPEKKSAPAAIEDTTKAPEAAPGAEAPRPYDPQFTRLAEVMGALAFLRDLCKAGDGDDWRDKMSALLAADAPNGPRRQKLVGAFNRGFRGYELTYRACTSNAEAAIARYLAEAEHITADVTYRYGAP